MSRLFIIFMIVLLPLRAWAGDLMGVQMATSGTVSRMAVEMPEDCPMLAVAQASDTEPGHPAKSTGQGCCASCELCTPVARLDGAVAETVAFAGHVKPSIAAMAFVSAPRALSFRPPIY